MCDNHPKTKDEAVALERLLSGLDLEAEKALIDGASRIAPPPSDLLPDIHRPLTSGLDAVFLLNAVNADQLVERAISRERKQKPPLKKGQGKENVLSEEVILFRYCTLRDTNSIRSWSVSPVESRMDGQGTKSSWKTWHPGSPSLMDC